MRTNLWNVWTEARCAFQGLGRHAWVMVISTSLCYWCWSPMHATVLCAGSTVRTSVWGAHADVVCGDLHLCALYNH